MLGELPESVYKPLDPVKVCRAFYDGIGLPVDDVLKRSDLYEKPGKNPHAFRIDIDRRGRHPRAGEHRARPGMAGHHAARVGPCRRIPRMSPRGLPYVLHTDAHPLCTEGVAMMFERFAQNVDWLRAFGAEVSDPERFRTAAAKLRRNRLLVFSRYCQVMFRFEMALYGNPEPGFEPVVVGPGGEIPGDPAARGARRARFRQQVPSDRRPGLLPQLHAGRDVRLAGASRAGSGGAAGRPSRPARFTWATRRRASS